MLHSIRFYINYYKNYTHSDKGSEWKNDSSGNENAQTDPEAPNSDPQNNTSTGSPPRDKDANDRRSKLFRAVSNTPSNAGVTSTANTIMSQAILSSGGGGKKKQSLSLSAEPSKSSVLDTCLSPTNVEPRKSLLDQLTRTFSTEEAILPDVVAIVGPPEPFSGFLTQRLAPLLAATFRPIFSPHNTAEVKVVLQALMNKIHK